MTKNRIAGVLTLAVASTVLAVLPANSGAKPFIGEGRVDIKIFASPATCAAAGTKCSTVVGILASKRESCERDRTLVLVHRVRGVHDHVYDVDRSSYNGSFSIDLNDKVGVYTLTVTQRGDCNSRTERVQ